MCIYIQCIYECDWMCACVFVCVCVGYERNYMIYLEGLGFPPQEKAEIRNLKIMSWRLFGMVILSRIALTGSFLLADAWNAPWNLWWLHNLGVERVACEREGNELSAKIATQHKRVVQSQALFKANADYYDYELCFPPSKQTSKAHA